MYFNEEASVFEKGVLKHTFRILGWAFLLSTLLFIIFYVLLGVIEVVGGDAVSSNQLFLDLSSYFIAYVPSFTAFTLILKRLPEIKPEGGLKISLKKALSCLGVLFGSEYFMLLVGNSLLQKLGLIAESADSENGSFIIVMLSYAVIAPLCEEYIFRRLLINRILVLGEGTAVLISAVFFGFSHLTFGMFLHTFAAGLVFGYVYVKTGKLRYSIMLHMINNFISGGYGYLPDIDSLQMALGISVIVLIIYAVVYMIRHKPWRNFCPDSNGFTRIDKLKASFQSVTFWLAAACQIAFLTGINYLILLGGGLN